MEQRGKSESGFPRLMLFSYPVGRVYFTIHCTTRGWGTPSFLRKYGSYLVPAGVYITSILNHRMAHRTCKGNGGGYFNNFTITSTGCDGHDDDDHHHPVPAPGTMMLLGSGLAGLVGFNRRRFKK